MKKSKMFIGLGALVLTASAFVAKKLFTTPGVFSISINGGSYSCSFSPQLPTFNDVSSGQQYFTTNMNAINATRLHIKTSNSNTILSTLKTSQPSGSILYLATK